MRNVILTVGLMAFVSCMSNTSNNDDSNKPEIDIKNELAAIEEVRSNVMLAIKEARYQDIGQWVTPNAKTIRPGGPAFDEMFTLGKERGIFPYDSIVMTPTETVIMNDSTAYDWGSSKTYYTNKDGEPVELKNSFLVILKKMDGQWKLHREVASSIVE